MRSTPSLLTLGASLVVVACTTPPAPASRSTLPAAEPGSEPAARTKPHPGASAPASAPAHWTLLWGKVEVSKGCFYFIGPPGSGARRIHPGISQVALSLPGGAAELRLGKARFLGRRVGDTVTLQRRARFQHRGSWRVDEKLRLERGKDGWRGRYRYEECDESGREGCPGRCEIRAKVQLDRAP